MVKKIDKVIVENNQPMSFEDVMSERFARYSKYIIQERALPDARDGLKPVQRRILYAMYHEGNIANKGYRKSAKTVGIVIGNYHPHGDSSVYDAMVRLSQNWKMNHCLVDMHGNNGSIDDDPAAAMRYTEARLDAISMTMTRDIDYKTVLFAPNFDDTEDEPTVLPSQFPLLLVNGATGIAAGYATNIAPHNLGEIIDATVYCLQNENACVDDLLTFIQGPDFPTGGIVQGKEHIKDVFTNGKGRVVVRCKSEVIHTKTIKQIVITEIPYEVVKSDLVKQIDEIRMSKDLEGMMDVRDESDRNGLSVVIDLKKDCDDELVMNYLLKNTNLQIYYNYNMVAIINKRPVQCSLLDLIDSFICFRKEVVLNRSNYLLNQITERLNILEGLMKAVSIMDDIIALIRSADDKQDAKSKLIEAYLFNEAQAEAIVTLRLYRLTNTDINSLKLEFAKLINEMEELKSIINNESILRSVITKELRNIKETFARPRKTIIEDEIVEIVIDKTKMIQNDKTMVTVSRDGYIKRVSLRSFTASEGQFTGIKEGDQLVGAIECELLDTLLMFTDAGNYGYLPVYQIEEMKWKDVGQHLNLHMKIEHDESIINAIVVRNFDSYAFILSISSGGMIKKSFVKDYVLQRNSKLSVAMKLKSKEKVQKTILVYPNDDIVLTTADGYNSRYNERLIAPVGIKSQGVKAIKLTKNDELVNVSVLKGSEAYILVFDNAKMKRIKNEDLQVTSRPVKGERIIKKFKNNPPIVIDGLSASIYADLNFVDDELQILQAKDIPLMGKETTYSSPIALKDNFYRIKGIEEVVIVDCPDDYHQDISIDEEVVVDEEFKEEVIHDDYVMEPLL